jgi:hypothetical protein
MSQDWTYLRTMWRTYTEIQQQNALLENFIANLNNGILARLEAAADESVEEDGLCPAQRNLLVELERLMGELWMTNAMPGRAMEMESNVGRLDRQGDVDGQLPGVTLPENIEDLQQSLPPLASQVPLPGRLLGEESLLTRAASNTYSGTYPEELLVLNLLRLQEILGVRERSRSSDGHSHRVSDVRVRELQPRSRLTPPKYEEMKKLPCAAAAA